MSKLLLVLGLALTVWAGSPMRRMAATPPTRGSSFSGRFQLEFASDYDAGEVHPGGDGFDAASDPGVYLSNGQGHPGPNEQRSLEAGDAVYAGDQDCRSGDSVVDYQVTSF